MEQIAEKRKNIQIFYNDIMRGDVAFSAREKVLKEEAIPDEFTFGQKGVVYKIKQWLHSAKQSVRETFATSIWKNMYLTRLKSGIMVSAIPQKYRNDPDIVEEFMWQYPLSTYFLQRGPELRYNKRLCVIACLLNPENIHYLPFENKAFVQEVFTEIVSYTNEIIKQQLLNKVETLPAPFVKEEKTGEQEVTVYKMNYVPVTILKEPAQYTLLPFVTKEVYTEKEGKRVLVSSQNLSEEESRTYINTYAKGNPTMEDVLKNIKVVKKTSYADVTETKTYYYVIDNRHLTYNLTLMEKTDRVNRATGETTTTHAIAPYSQTKLISGKLNLPLEMFDVLKMLQFEMYRVEQMEEGSADVKKLDVIGATGDMWKDNRFLTFGKERCITMYAHKEADAEKEGVFPDSREPDFYITVEEDKDGVVEKRNEGYYIDVAYPREEIVSILETSKAYVQEHMQTKQQENQQQAQR